METATRGAKGRLGQGRGRGAGGATAMAIALAVAIAGQPATGWAQGDPDGEQGATQGAAQGATQGAEMAQRLELLSRAIEDEGDRQRTARVAAGVSGLVGGGALLVGGVLLYDECGDGGLSGLCKVGAIMLGAGGVGGILGGTVALMWKRGNERAAERFAEDTRGATDLGVAVTRGEVVLQGMADQARKDRYWRGGSWLAAGALLGLSAAFGDGESEGASVGVGAVSLVLVGGWGVVELLWPDPVERDWDSYRARRDGDGLSGGDLWRRVYAAPVVSPNDTHGGFTGFQAGFVF